MLSEQWAWLRQTELSHGVSAWKWVFPHCRLHYCAVHFWTEHQLKKQSAVWAKQLAKLRNEGSCPQNSWCASGKHNLLWAGVASPFSSKAHFFLTNRKGTPTSPPWKLVIWLTLYVQKSGYSASLEWSNTFCVSCFGLKADFIRCLDWIERGKYIYLILSQVILTYICRQWKTGDYGGDTFAKMDLFLILRHFQTPKVGGRW